MYSKISKFLIIVMLVFTSVSICLPNDVECVTTDFSFNVLNNNHDFNKDIQDSEMHHCLCLFSCHGQFLSSTKNQLAKSIFILGNEEFVSVDLFYPSVYLSSDRPPII